MKKNTYPYLLGTLFSEELILQQSQRDVVSHSFWKLYILYQISVFFAQLWKAIWYSVMVFMICNCRQAYCRQAIFTIVVYLQYNTIQIYNTNLQYNTIQKKFISVFRSFTRFHDSVRISSMQSSWDWGKRSMIIDCRWQLANSVFICVIIVECRRLPPTVANKTIFLFDTTCDGRRQIMIGSFHLS